MRSYKPIVSREFEERGETRMKSFMQLMPLEGGEPHRLGPSELQMLKEFCQGEAGVVMDSRHSLQLLYKATPPAVQDHLLAMNDKRKRGRGKLFTHFLLLKRSDSEGAIIGVDQDTTSYVYAIAVWDGGRTGFCASKRIQD